MSSYGFPIAEARRHPRLPVPAMYTLLRVRRVGDTTYRHTGYIYDISLSGMRFELDEPMEPGAAIEIRGMLPGDSHATIRATGHIVRVHEDEDAPGPVRMAMAFETFQNETDVRRLTSYLTHHGRKRAA